MAALGDVFNWYLFIIVCDVCYRHAHTKCTQTSVNNACGSLTSPSDDGINTTNLFKALINLVQSITSPAQDANSSIIQDVGQLFGTYVDALHIMVSVLFSVHPAD